MRTGRFTEEQILAVFGETDGSGRWLYNRRHATFRWISFGSQLTTIKRA